MGTQVLFVDDSGKSDAKHASQVIVQGGFSVAVDAVPTLSRRVLGAKAKFFASRNSPTHWEIKSKALIASGPWKRRNNRAFAEEIVDIVHGLGGTFYSACIDKRRLRSPMKNETAVPMLLQALAEHYSVECDHRGAVGIIVSDRSNSWLDNHASMCMASFVASRKLPLHRGIYFAGSHTSEGIQVADLVAGAVRRHLEGAGELNGLIHTMRGHSWLPQGRRIRTCEGYWYRNHIKLL